MTETENKNFPTKPLPPMSPAKQVLLYTGLGAGIGAAINTGRQVIVNWLGKTKEPFNKSNVVGYAIAMGALSAIIGYFTGRRENKEYDQSKPIVLPPKTLTQEESSEVIKELNEKFALTPEEEEKLEKKLGPRFLGKQKLENASWEESVKAAEGQNLAQR